MSVHYNCDYCGEAIGTEDTRVELRVSGEAEDGSNPNRYITTKSISGYVGHYHTTHERPCWWRILDAVRLTESIGPTLETMETITGQAVAARRRKHSQEDKS